MVPAAAAPPTPPPVPRPAPTASFQANPDTAGATGPTWTATLGVPSGPAAASFALVLPTVYGNLPAFSVSPSVPAQDATIDGRPAARVDVLPVTTAPSRGPPAGPHGPRSADLSLPGLNLGAGALAPVAIVVTPAHPLTPGPVRTVTLSVDAPGAANPPVAGTYPVAVALVGPGHPQIAMTTVTIAPPSTHNKMIIIGPGGGGGGCTACGGSGSGGGPQSVSFSAQLGPIGGGALSPVPPYTTSNTPCTTLLGVTLCSGANGSYTDQDGATGMVSVGGFATGIATQLTENSLSGSIAMPNTTGATNANDSFTANISVITELAANNIGALSNVSITTLQMLETSSCDSQEQPVSVSTGVTIGLPDGESQLASMIANAEGPLQGAVEGAASGQNLQSVLQGAVGVNLLVTTFSPISCSLPAGQNASFTITPKLVVGNAGLGGTAAYAISYVTVQLSGTETPSRQTSTTTVTGPSSVSFNQPFNLTASVSPNPGDGTEVYFEYPTTLGGPVINACFLSNGTCSAGVIPDFVPAGADSVTTWWNGNANYQGSSGSTTVNVTQGTSTTGLTVTGNPAVGQPITLDAQVSGIGNTAGNLTPAVTFFDGSGQEIGTCVPGYVSGACSITWTPSATSTYQLQAAWPGDGDLQGSESPVQSITIHPAGYYLSASAAPLFIGYGESCIYNRLTKTYTCTRYFIGNSSTVTATLLDNGVAAAGQVISFSSSPGGETFSPASCSTGSNGACSATFQVTGPPSKNTTYTITASGDGASATATVIYNP